MNSTYGKQNESWVDSSVTNNLRTGGNLSSSVKNKLVQVRKSWLNKGTVAAYATYSNDSCFILSKYELGSNISGGLGKLGVGPNRDELYLHFKSLGMQTGIDNKAIIANLGFGDFWLRDRLGYVNDIFAIAAGTANGNIENEWHGHMHSANFIPCFCF